VDIPQHRPNSTSHSHPQWCHPYLLSFIVTAHNGNKTTTYPPPPPLIGPSCILFRFDGGFANEISRVVSPRLWQKSTKQHTAHQIRDNSFHRKANCTDCPAITCTGRGFIIIAIIVSIIRVASKTLSFLRSSSTKCNSVNISFQTPDPCWQLAGLARPGLRLQNSGILVALSRRAREYAVLQPISATNTAKELHPPGTDCVWQQWLLVALLDFTVGTMLLGIVNSKLRACTYNVDTDAHV